MDFPLIQPKQQSSLSPAEEIKLRTMAKSFEALLLNQLTSALNNVNSDEDSLFGTDGGADLAKKLFSEQLATAMADAGGIGLSDTILRQFGLESKKPVAPLKGNAAAPEIGSSAQARPFEQMSRPVINKGNRPAPVGNEGGLSNKLEVISLDAETENAVDDDAWRNAFADPANGIDYTNPANMLPAQNTEKASEGFVMPVDGRISSRFGSRFHPIDGKQKFHGGVDIAAPRGTPIAATADGEVVFSGRRGGYGNMVIVRHNDGSESRYAHADKLSVSEGQKVKAGETIATVGSTGKSTGPHLHFEVRIDGAPVNPFGLDLKFPGK